MIGVRAFVRTAAVAVAVTLPVSGCAPSGGPDTEEKQAIGATLSAFASLACARYVEEVGDADLRDGKVDPAAPSVRAFFDAVEANYTDCSATADWDEVDVDDSEARATDGGITYTLDADGNESTGRDDLAVTLRKIDGAWWVVELG